MRNFTLLNLVLKKVLMVLCLSWFSGGVLAESIEAVQFDNPQQARRYQTLIDEIRCPVCQGQSIGGSNAGLAQDLRAKVRELIIEARSDADIRNFMTDRYGDFVVFKPPMNASTLILWFAPFGFLIFGMFFFIRAIIRKKPAENTPVLDTTKADDLLK